MKYKKIRSKGGEKIGAVPTRGAPRQKQSKGGKPEKGNGKSNKGKAKKGK